MFLGFTILGCVYCLIITFIEVCLLCRDLTVELPFMLSHPKPPEDPTPPPTPAKPPSAPGMYTNHYQLLTILNQIIIIMCSKANSQQLNVTY